MINLTIKNPWDIKKAEISFEDRKGQVYKCFIKNGIVYVYKYNTICEYKMILDWSGEREVCNEKEEYILYKVFNNMTKAKTYYETLKNLELILNIDIELEV